jgi:hypothetical protein
MTQNQSPDEQVYQNNKGEVEVKTVYTNADPDMAQEAEIAEDQADADAEQDEMLEETFPASDPPASSISTPAPPDES